MKPVLEVNELWKEYKRGAQNVKYLSLRENLFEKFRKTVKESFWALSDVNFEIQAGESVAIIGKNGAGKSTLLKILSRITPPTKGEIVLRGRLASLLEVGTGFHPELTGRENIFLNGSILGLNKGEVERKFEEIVDFSGVEKFLQTPLKHYSSGMQLRLAFSVAAHLEPEILIIDEVLAVGDSVFQQKCIRKMSEVSQSGRTILFVSHNLKAIRNLCDRALLLEEGKLIKDGDIEAVIREYSSHESAQSSTFDLANLKDRNGKGEIRFAKLEFSNPLLKGVPIVFKLQFDSDRDFFSEIELAVAILDMENTPLIHISNRFQEKELQYNGRPIKISIQNILRPGNYKLVLFLKSGETIQDWIRDEIVITINDTGNSILDRSKGITNVDFSITEFINHESE